MRKFILAAAVVVIVVVLVSLGNFSFLPWKAGSSGHVVAITQIATHPALDDVRAGIVQRLETLGYRDQEQISIVFKNANGDGALTATIAQDFARLNPSVIVPISTPSALAVAAATKEVPIVFSGVTQPVKVGLVDSLEGGGGNITGVSDKWPFEDQVRTFFRYFPKARKIGMIYTRGDDVSDIGVTAMRALSRKLDFELELRAVADAADIYPTAQALLREVDAVYTGIDHLVLENMEGLVRAAREAERPLFGGETGSVEKGAVLAVSINMRQFGHLTADLVAAVLKGTAPGQIPVATVTEGELVVNRAVAERFDLDIESLRKDGARIVD